MKIAVPIWEDKVSPVLDTAARLLILETFDRSHISRTEAFLDEREISKRCFRIQKLGIDVLICGAVSRPFSDILAAAGISIIPGISGAVEEIVAAYFGGTLNQAKYLMPGCSRIQTSAGHKLPPGKKLSRRTIKKK